MTPSALARLLADDLSGAAEAAGILHRHGLAASVLLESRASTGAASVQDLDVRNAGDAAADRIALGFSAGPRPDYIKIDSQLRGPVQALLAAALERSAVVLAPALPTLGRTVRDGVPLIDDAPLGSARGSAWHREPHPAPERLRDLVPKGVSVRHASLDEVRSGAFAERLQRLDDGERTVHIPDSADASDLDAIARALCAAPPSIIPIGSAGLLEALASAVLDTAPAPGSPPHPAERVVLVLGSIEPAVTRQHAAIRADRVEIAARPHGDPTELAAQIAAALDTPTRLVVVRTGAASGTHDVSVARRVGTAVAEAVRRDAGIGLALIGGETARRTLQALGESALAVTGEVHPGAVLGVVSGGRPVVTRPGSFGRDDSLELIITTLLGGLPRGDHQKEGSL
ncbi:MULTISPECIES: four-carbon acid sugar kinase family protein [unclassified Microbacterium]|uniref:four-carbon acid sugar kinase family protein n=1 Tax=Microbacterium TaxID=33882 RepID=UPI003BA1800F